MVRLGGAGHEAGANAKCKMQSEKCKSENGRREEACGGFGAIDFVSIDED